ncbi:MAG: ATP-binding protein [Candidatus Solibacter sp.]
MFNSVRWRLTMWFTAVLALVLVGFAGSVYFAVKRQAFTRLDAGLSSVLQVVSLSLGHEIEEHKGQQPGETAFRELLTTMHQGSFPRHAIAVYRDSQVVGLKPADNGLAAPPNFPGQALPRFFTEGMTRIATAGFTVPHVAQPYRIVVAERLDETLADLNLLFQTLLFSVPLAVLLAGVIGYLLARKSLAPVVAMSNDVDRLGSGNLADRIEVANPRDELGKLAGTFNRLLGRLQLSFDRQRRFMADASHELRTPISVARSAAQVNLAKAERPAAEYREALDIIEKQMSRLTRVVNDLFLLAKSDTDAAAVHRRRFALDETVRETVQAAQVLAAPKQVEVTAAPLAESPFEGDADLIRQLLLLLLDNAVKYSPAGGRVQVGLRRAQDDYEITVTDTGIGIPVEDQPRIFERFYRVDKARSRSASSITGGAGLGLSIGQWIAEAHGGLLRLLRSSSEGSVFLVRLPAKSRDHSTMNE